jgi:hypothetical protein
MFIRTKYSGYNRHGEQVAAGLFLILMEPKDTWDSATGTWRKVPIKAIVRHSSFHQLGHFMMGFARIHGTRITLSGSYGGDGLTCRVPNEIYERYGVELPQELYDAWNKGGGWNSAGSEAPLMRKWALENLEALRK